MAANSSGDKASGIHTTKQIFLSEAPGPMGDAPQKRPLEDGDQPGAKKLASFLPGSFVDPALGNQNSNVMNESMRLPDDLVGLIIGRGGENIMKMQRETGCRIQITQGVPGTKERPCTLSGTPEQIEVCKHMLNEIIARSQAGTLGDNFGLNPGGMPGGPPGMGGGMGDGLEKQIEMAIPADKCGLIIGKGGETIKMLQQSLGCKMLLVQDSTENVGISKPLRITGTQPNIDNAVNAIHQMMAQRDKQIAEQKMNSGGGGGGMFGDDSQVIPVPKAAVGVVIGKGGDMINQIQNMTATRIQFKPEDAHLPDRICTVTGSKDGVDAAIGRIQQIINNVLERDGGGPRGPPGGGGGRMRGPPGGGMGGFGQWESPNMNRGRPMGGGVTTEEHLVPANKTGLVIGKGGETIKQINMQSGAHAEILRNPPPGSDLSYKTFLIKGTIEQIKMCRQLIQDKVDDRGGMPGGPMGGPHQGPPQGGPPMGNFGPPPHQNNFGGMPPGGMPHQNPMHGPPQGQPGQPFQQQQPQQQQPPPQQPQPQQQPWGNQFQQWTPPAAAAAATATPPQQNGKPPVADANSAAWQSYMQLYAHSQPGYQAPAATQAAVAAAPAVPAPAAAAAPVAAAVPDYSKQWDEYLKQTGAAAAAAAAAQATAPAVAAQALQAQQVAAATPAAAVPAAAAAAQPATTQADYSAAWAEYYRQYYQIQGQQYAAVAGQPPAQT